MSAQCLAVLVALAGPLCGAAQLAAQTAVVAADVVRLSGGTPDPITVTYARLGIEGRTSLAGVPLAYAALIQADLDHFDASLVDVGEFLLRLTAGPIEGLIGIGRVAWGVSETRSPIDVMVPRAVFQDMSNGPRLGQPMVEVSVLGDWGNLDAVLFPFPRPPHFGGRLAETWGGLSVASGLEWGDQPVGGLRLTRTLGPTDIALSYVRGGDRRLWIIDQGLGDAALDIVSLEQFGFEVQHAVGSVVLSAEGSLEGPNGDVEARVVGGLNWFPTPYLTLTLEHGVTSTDPAEASPLLDDLMLGAQIITEDLRLSTQAFVDPRSGNQHHFVIARWTATETTAIELDVLAWTGDAAQEPALALRQTNAVTVSLIKFF